MFAWLLASADPVFSKFFSWELNWQLDGEQIVLRMLLTGFLAFIAFGLLRLVAMPLLAPKAISLKISEVPAFKERLGFTEFAWVFGSLTALLAVFLVVQVRYLFGGNDVVLAQEGLTYAAYARRGFFELSAAAGLGVTLFLVLSSLLDLTDERRRRFHAALGVIFLLSLGFLLASAAQRRGLYVDVYGLTRLRIFVSFAIAAMGVGFLGIVGLILARRMELAPAWCVCLCFGSLIAYNAANPDGMVARFNLSRDNREQQIDYANLTRLSGDAAAEIRAGLSSLPPKSKASLEAALAEHWSQPTGDWRSFSFGRNARTMLPYGEPGKSRADIKAAQRLQADWPD